MIFSAGALEDFANKAFSKETDTNNSLRQSWNKANISREVSAVSMRMTSSGMRVANQNRL